MKIIETPSELLGHRFRQNEFLLWIRETRSLTTARNWANVLSPYAKAKWMDSREQIQERFAELYEAFCLEKGIDHSDVGYDNFDYEEYKRVIAQKAERQILVEGGMITARKIEMLWEVLEDGEEIPATQEPQVNESVTDEDNKMQEPPVDNLESNNEDISDSDLPEVTIEDKEFLVRKKFLRKDNAVSSSRSWRDAEYRRSR